VQGLRFSTKRGSLKLVPRFVEHGQIFDDFLVNRSVDAGTTQLVENFTISKPAQGLRVVGNHLLPSPGSCRNFTDFVEYIQRDINCLSGERCEGGGWGSTSGNLPEAV